MGLGKGDKKLNSTTMKATYQMSNNQEVYNLIQWCVAWVGGSVSFVLVVNSVANKILKYLADGREEQLKRIVRQEVSPEISELKDAIDKLQEAIWALKNRG